MQDPNDSCEYQAIDMSSTDSGYYIPYSFIFIFTNRSERTFKYSHRDVGNYEGQIGNIHWLVSNFNELGIDE